MNASQKSSFMEAYRPQMAMLFVQIVYAGMALFSKAAINEGMSPYVFVVYRQAIATLVLAPFAYFLERKKAPPLPYTVLCKIFFTALVGITLSSTLYYVALNCTSATFAATTTNAIPVITFIMAALLRMEKISTKHLYGVAKVLGSLLCVSGVLMAALYKGPPITFMNWYPSLHREISNPSVVRCSLKMELLKGSLLMLAGNTAWSMWLILQGLIVQSYPAKLHLTTLQCFFASIQSAVVAIILERNPSSWKLGWDLNLLSVTYCGVIVTGISYWLQVWCIEKKGPVFTAMFTPLSLLITAIISAFLWKEIMHWGRFISPHKIWSQTKENSFSKEKLTPRTTFFLVLSTPTISWQKLLVFLHLSGVVIRVSNPTKDSFTFVTLINRLSLVCFPISKLLKNKREDEGFDLLACWVSLFFFSFICLGFVFPKMGRDFSTFLHGMKPVAIMVVVQIVFAGVNIFYKLAVMDGMSLKILVAYRSIFGTVFLGPLAFFVERKSRPTMTWTVVFQAFCCGLFGGTLTQNLYIGSLSMTSATFASAMTNLVPGITFIMAVIVGLERLGVRMLSGQAKVGGTLIGISGAMLLTFYKGVEIDLWSTSINLVGHHQQHSGHQVSGNRVMGSLLAVASCISYSIWLIIQTKMTKRYPCHYSGTALMCLMASIQSVVFAFCTERDWAQWRLGWNIRLLTVFYSGVLASGLTVTVIAWCIQRRGPLFVSVFNPLMLVIVALVGSLILDEKLHLGSVLGAVLIITGLYVVLWGKGKEMKEMLELPVKSPKSSMEGETLATEMGGIGCTTGSESKKMATVLAPKQSNDLD
ncbi:uncharacterized protein LOC143880576 [Tasmannia lanceolata]|uniref:uncharacterized protein LOC143880576 n=1 Tax=Tasmannia lanceolata TaxID=3420 RepID=UPI0040637009